MSKTMVQSSSNHVSVLSLHFLLMIITICYLVPSSCSETTDLNEISSCFIGHNINNFTLYSSGNVSAYFDLLNFSLQNLRFSELSVPKPSAIIVPKSKEEVSSIVLCCRKWSFDIRIRSGGHSYEGISSSSSFKSSNRTTNSAPFVVIDLMSLDKVSLDLESETAWVEGGATLGQTYYAIAESSNVHGFPAGVCPTVGVGGHFSGGGYGFLGRKYGVSADNVVDALLVDAKGRILDRDSMGEDVFWAIRGGGGGNWGIIFAWKIMLVRVPKVVTVLSVARPQHTKHQVENIIQQYQNVVHDLDDQFQLLVFVSSGLVPESNEIAVIIQGLYQGPRSKAISILTDSFAAMEIKEEECKEMSWIESVDYLSDFSGGQGSISSLKQRYFEGKSYFKTKSDYVRKPIPPVGIKILIDFLQKQPKAYALFEPYGGFMERTRSDAIAFPHRKGNIFSIEYTITWDEMDDQSGKSKKHMNWIRRFYDAMAPFVSSNPRAAYVNYMDLDLGHVIQDFGSTSRASPVDMARAWGDKYFLKNYDRLVKAKTIIDPRNVFRHQQSLPPLISLTEKLCFNQGRDSGSEALQQPCHFLV
ncbi:Reticuline oxidase [Heracleum sosnowskyi]|uniref:Reticuline oxidase n=1 Tax=Heracleum sosnowskyi TaxID=360622 RepID=A0AAD8JFD6_9APIA|nr:Reticuline oxidase [Heracleum sosnowskyi]